MIERIRLNNVRSFVGSHEVPLRKFTLLYGSNGAGKSTIIEAIQLVFTGSSDRTSPENISELVKHVRSEGVPSGLLIELFARNGTALPSFSDTGSSLTYSDLLKSWYNWEAHHKTAKSLLDTLFATHNLITQERIIKLLDSDSKSAFYGAIEEMIVGRNLMERWQKVEHLKRILEKTRNDCVKKKSEADQELTHLEAHIKEWDSTSAAAGLGKYEEIKETAKKAGIKLNGEPRETSLEALLVWVRNARQSVQAFSNSIDRVGQLYLESTDCINVPELVEKRAVAARRLQELETVVSQHREKLSSIRDKFKSKQKEIAEKARKWQEMIDRVAKAEETYMKWKLVDDWKQELLCEFTSQEIEKELLNARSRYELLQKIATLKAELPTVEAFNSLSKEFTDNSHRMEKIKSEVDANTAQLLSKKEALHALETDFEHWRRQQGELASLFENLSQITQQYLEKEDHHTCPTCGTDFVSKEKLLEVFAKSRESIRKRQEIELPSRFKTISRDRAEVEKLQLSVNQSGPLLDELIKKLSAFSERLGLWLGKAMLLWKLLQELHVTDIQKPSENTLSLFFAKIGEIGIDDELRSLLDKMTSLEAQLAVKWAGLRKLEYENARSVLLAKFEPTELGILKNSIRDSESWIAHIDKIHVAFQGAVSQRDREHSELQKDEMELNKTSNEMNSVLAIIKENEELIGKTKVEIQKLTAIMSETEQLRVNLSDPADKIELRMLRGAAADLLARISALEESLLVSINAHKERAQNEARKQEIKRSIETQARQLTVINQLLNNLKKITGLGSRIQQEWTKYSQNINAMFSRLHSPPDYNRVILKNSSEGFDIEVVSRRTSDERDATVLSSGQRAALAISIFWTLNIYGAKIPPVMLMDEPIQQIDDLNTLNFLDSLRWIAEKGKRQIILSTANSRLAGLIKRKFSYMGEDYAEVHIERNFGMSPFIKCVNGSGEIFYESVPKRLAG